MELTSKQRAFLRKQAAMLDTIFQVGKGGVTDNMTEQVSNALEARELIKLRVLENSDYNAALAAEEIAEATGAAVVQVIGTRFVLYRPSQNKPKIDLRDADRKKRLTAEKSDAEKRAAKRR